MSSDSYIDLVRENIHGFVRLHQRFKGKKPVMLYDVAERRVYAMPYEGFKAELSAQSQQLLARQYDKANSRNMTVIFVKDMKNQKLVSFNFDLDSAESEFEWESSEVTRHDGEAGKTAP